MFSDFFAVSKILAGNLPAGPPTVVSKRSPVLKPPPFLADNIASISQQLKLLSDHLSGLADSPSPALAPPVLVPVAPKLLSSLSPDKVVRLVHCLGSLSLPVRPCNWSYGSDTKTHWTRRSFTVLLGATVSAIIGTSYRPASMANGLMGGSFHYCLALT